MEHSVFLKDRVICVKGYGEEISKYMTETIRELGGTLDPNDMVISSSIGGILFQFEANMSAEQLEKHLYESVKDAKGKGFEIEELTV